MEVKGVKGRGKGCLLLNGGLVMPLTTVRNAQKQNIAYHIHELTMRASCRQSVVACCDVAVLLSI